MNLDGASSFKYYDPTDGYHVRIIAVRQDDETYEVLHQKRPDKTVPWETYARDTAEERPEIDET